jgi:transcription antitermination factor NusG
MIYTLLRAPSLGVDRSEATEPVFLGLSMAIACLFAAFGSFYFIGLHPGAVMLFADMGPWFALQVVPRHEKSVARILEHKGCDHFLPTCSVRRRWSDRVKIVAEPLFPGYVFCRSQRNLLAIIRGFPGILRIVAFGGIPHPIPDKEIEALQQIVHGKREYSAVPHLSVGQKVQVISGPLTGISGIITQFKNRDRLVISLDVIMKSVSVEINQLEVVLVQAAA